MKVLVLALLSLFVYDAPSTEIHEMRTLFPLIHHHETAVEKLKGIAGTRQHSAVHNAYAAAAEMASAQFKFNPLTKLSVFQSGKHKLEECIARNPLQPELRYIRFVIQSRVPAFLGYSSNLNQDKQFLLSQLIQLRQHDLHLYEQVAAFLLSSGNLSPKEKTLIPA